MRLFTQKQDKPKDKNQIEVVQNTAASTLLQPVRQLRTILSPHKSHYVIKIAVGQTTASEEPSLDVIWNTQSLF